MAQRGDLQREPAAHRQQYLRKGTKVYIEGQLETRKATDQSGGERYFTEVVLRQFRGELTILDSKGGSSQSGDDYSGGAISILLVRQWLRRRLVGGGRSSGGERRPAAAASGGRWLRFGGGSSGGDLDDEIPFEAVREEPHPEAPGVSRASKDACRAPSSA